MARYRIASTRARPATVASAARLLAALVAAPLLLPGCITRKMMAAVAGERLVVPVRVTGASVVKGTLHVRALLAGGDERVFAFRRRDRRGDGVYESSPLPAGAALPPSDRPVVLLRPEDYRAARDGLEAGRPYLVFGPGDARRGRVRPLSPAERERALVLAEVRWRWKKVNLALAGLGAEERSLVLEKAKVPAGTGRRALAWVLVPFTLVADLAAAPVFLFYYAVTTTI